MLENLHRFAIFTLLTSTAGWDTGRAITNTVAILVVGPAVLATLRRASRKASYGIAATFSSPRPRGHERSPAASRPMPVEREPSQVEAERLRGAGSFEEGTAPTSPATSDA
ncbi:hypothetical protein O7603_32210 [Micromonospora sp. WMMD812]|nr:hypothetical protein [Micromonospora sp. WMMD812]WBB67684.1 hypothetical protein O7603_32210 [Micromonospora sp. WMMD812]